MINKPVKYKIFIWESDALGEAYKGQIIAIAKDRIEARMIVWEHIIVNYKPNSEEYVNFKKDLSKTPIIVEDIPCVYLIDGSE